MNDDILNLMEEWRLAKNDRDKYRAINRAIKAEINKAKECWMRERCRELDKLEEKHDIFQKNQRNSWNL